MNATELGKLSKLSHTFLNVQCHPSNTATGENLFNEQVMDFYNIKERPI